MGQRSDGGGAQLRKEGVGIDGKDVQKERAKKPLRSEQNEPWMEKETQGDRAGKVNQKANARKREKGS